MKAIYRAKKVLSQLECNLHYANKRFSELSASAMDKNKTLNSAEAWELKGKIEALIRIKKEFNLNNICEYSSK